MPVKLDFAHGVFGCLVNGLILYLSTPTRQPHIPKGKRELQADRPDLTCTIL